jgi:hypothetical protein
MGAAGRIGAAMNALPSVNKSIEETKMQARLTTKPVQEVTAAIQALDLESVKLRVMDPERGEGWTRDRAESIETAYKNFLSMLVKYPDAPEDILLSEDVDEFWHTHILQTMKYADDCQRVFGNFLHHNPQIGERSSRDQEKQAALLEKTRSLYRQEFGDDRAAEIAWAGKVAGSRENAYCEAAARNGKSAYCEATVRSKPAYCEAVVRAGKAAYCEATVQSKLAYCEATVRNKPAYCEAAARVGKTAYCEASLRTEPAYCEATVRGKPAYCEATVQSKPAYCEAAIQTHRAS